MEHLSTPLIKTGKLHTHPLSLIVEHTPAVIYVCSTCSNMRVIYFVDSVHSTKPALETQLVHMLITKLVVCRSVYHSSCMTHLSAYDYKSTLVSLESYQAKSSLIPRPHRAFHHAWE